MSNITWFVEDTDKVGDLTKLKNSIVKSGAELLTVGYDGKKITCDKPFYGSKEGPVISYGTINFIKKLQNSGLGIYPLAYADPNKYDISTYVHILGNDYLNSDYVIYPLRDLPRIIETYKNQEVFIRPLDGYKTFSGGVFGKKVGARRLSDDLKDLMRDTMWMKDPLVLIASVRKIAYECRFVVVDNKIVSGSFYMKNDKIFEEECIKNDENAELFEYAEAIVERLSKTDLYYGDIERAYTLDIAAVTCGSDILRWTRKEHKVVEINSFSCAGLYACDTNKIVQAINEVVFKDCEEYWGGKLFSTPKETDPTPRKTEPTSKEVKPVPKEVKLTPVEISRAGQILNPVTNVNLPIPGGSAGKNNSSS
jgi:hypothetical protein